MTGLTDAGLMETSTVPYHEGNIEINKQRNTTQAIPKTLDSQINETTKIQRNKIIWKDMRIQKRIQVYMKCLRRLEIITNKMILRNKKIIKCIVKQHKKKRGEKGKKDTRAHKINSYFSK